MKCYKLSINYTLFDVTGIKDECWKIVEDEAKKVDMGQIKIGADYVQ